MSREEYKKRTITIAKGEYKPKVDMPKVWFESVKSGTSFELKMSI